MSTRPLPGGQVLYGGGGRQQKGAKFSIVQGKRHKPQRNKMWAVNRWYHNDWEVDLKGDQEVTLERGHNNGRLSCGCSALLAGMRTC